MYLQRNQYLLKFMSRYLLSKFNQLLKLKVVHQKFRNQSLLCRCRKIPRRAPFGIDGHHVHSDIKHTDTVPTHLNYVLEHQHLSVPLRSPTKFLMTVMTLFLKKERKKKKTEKYLFAVQRGVILSKQLKCEKKVKMRHLIIYSTGLSLDCWDDQKKIK